MEKADYVIVGGGTAGCVLARRLSEIPAKRVILVEAGEEARSWRYRIPAGTMKLIGDKQTDWLYPSEPDATLMGRRPLCPAGRMLGGSSRMNGMVYVRGTRGDYDGWAQSAPGWSFDELLPYFRRAENFAGDGDSVHGKAGPWQISHGRARHPLSDAFLSAGEELGIAHLPDYCDGNQDGAFHVWSMISEAGLRSDTASAFLSPVRQRPNLRIVTGRPVRRILFDGRRAIGIELAGQDGDRQILAGEVIVSAGAYGSPALLMRSGVGPAADVVQAGIPLVQDSPAMGQHLKDHLGAGVSKLVNVPTYNAPLGPLQYLRYGLDYALRRRGPIATSVVQAMLYGRSTPELRQPDFMLSFLPLCVNYRRSPPALHEKPGIHLGANICRPASEGRVTLNPVDPLGLPRIEHALLSDPHDIEVLIAALKFAQALFETPALARFVDAPCNPPAMPASDDEWRAFARETAGPSYHPVGTCRMGTGEDAPVDPMLRVKGCDGLRVADASVMPGLTSGNTVAPVVAIAEKAADLIQD